MKAITITIPDSEGSGSPREYRLLAVPRTAPEGQGVMWGATHVITVNGWDHMTSPTGLGPTMADRPSRAREWALYLLDRDFGGSAPYGWDVQSVAV